MNRPQFHDYEFAMHTRLLAFILAARFKMPSPMIAGILVTTILKHGLAGAPGIWITHAVAPDALRRVPGLSFIAMTIWTMIPDEGEQDQAQVARQTLLAASRCKAHPQPTAMSVG